MIDYFKENFSIPFILLPPEVEVCSKNIMICFNYAKTMQLKYQFSPCEQVMLSTSARKINILTKAQTLEKI